MPSASAYLQGKPCPKCSYVRTAADTNPEWQCPKCQIAYRKYRAGVSQLTSRVAAGGREIAVEAKADSSSYTLVAANLLVLGIAAFTGMTLRELVIAYWVQGLVIGTSFFIRILCLPLDRVTHMLPDGSHGPMSAGEKTMSAFGVLLAMIGLHFFYAVFLFSEPAARVSGVGVLLCALVFVLNHGYSLVRNISLDKRDQLRLGTLVSIPFMRIIPMHVIAATGMGLSPLATSFWGLLLFTLLKMGADVVMHVIEHHELRMGSSLRWLRDAHFDKEQWLEDQRVLERKRSV